MAKWLVINSLNIGSHVRYPGEQLDDAVHNVSAIAGAGVMLWPATDTVVAAAAAIVVAERKRGAGCELCAQMMLAAVAASVAGCTSAAPAIYAPGATSTSQGSPAGWGLQKATGTFGFAQLTASALTQVFNLGTAMPANARVFAHEIRVTTPFTGGVISAMSLSVGSGATPAEIVSACDVLTAGGNFSGTAGVDPQALYATSTQLKVEFTAVGANVKAATAGALAVDVLYTVLP